MNEMLHIRVGTNMSSVNVIVPSSKTLKEVLDENEVNYSTAIIFVNGATIKPADMGKTLDELGLVDNSYIIATQKTENA